MQLTRTKATVLPRIRDADHHTLIAFTYEAIDDEARWPAMLQELCAATDSAACFLNSYDTRTGVSRIIHATAILLRLEHLTEEKPALP